MDSIPFFASALNNAIVSSDLSMEQIVTRIKEQGLNISQSALSHWRSGRSVPKRKSSFEVITALEEILEQPAGFLIAQLKTDIALDSDKRKNNLPTNKHTNTKPLLDKLDDKTNWGNEVSREVIADRMIVAEDFLSCELQIFLLVRSEENCENPQLHVAVSGEPHEFETTSTFSLLEGLEGATIASHQTHNEDDEIVHTFCLQIPNDANSSLHRVFYKQHKTVPPEEPLRESNHRFFAWESKFYASTVEFLGTVPQTIEWVTERVEQNGDFDSVLSTISRTIEPVGNIAS
ncbi:MAG: hypothetical protein IKZ87_02030, partial [Actinomycetaceae bacterium]|nr:hypothetical protein [Actinomycetaceae bacterium]